MSACAVCQKHGCHDVRHQPVTERQASAAVAILAAVAEAIRALGSVPSSHLYAQVMGTMTLEQYQRVIDTLVGSGLVRRDASHLLTWVEPPPVNSR